MDFSVNLCTSFITENTFSDDTQKNPVLERANATLPNFGTTSWKGTIVRKGDVFIAKIM